MGEEGRTPNCVRSGGIVATGGQNGGVECCERMSSGRALLCASDAQQRRFDSLRSLRARTRRRQLSAAVASERRRASTAVPCACVRVRVCTPSALSSSSSSTRRPAQRCRCQASPQQTSNSASIKRYWPVSYCSALAQSIQPILARSTSCGVVVVSCCDVVLVAAAPRSCRAVRAAARLLCAARRGWQAERGRV